MVGGETGDLGLVRRSSGRSGIGDRGSSDRGRRGIWDHQVGGDGGWMFVFSEGRGDRGLLSSRAAMEGCKPQQWSGILWSRRDCRKGLRRGKSLPGRYGGSPRFRVSFPDLMIRGFHFFWGNRGDPGSGRVVRAQDAAVGRSGIKMRYVVRLGGGMRYYLREICEVRSHPMMSHQLSVRVDLLCTVDVTVVLFFSASTYFSAMAWTV